MRAVSLAAVGLMLWAQAAWAATVTILDQTRLVQTTATSDSPSSSDTKSDSDVAPDAGPFSGSAVAAASAPFGEFTYVVTASASQDSTLSPTQFRFSGDLSSGSELTGLDELLSLGSQTNASSTASIDFHVDAPTTLTPVLQLDPTPANATLTFFASIHQGGAEIAIFGPDFDAPSPIDLAAGDYTFSTEASVARVQDMFKLGPQSTSYRVEANFSTTDTGGGGGGTPIPLPPAVWSGMAALGLACAPALRSSLRRFIRGAVTPHQTITRKHFSAIVA